MALTRSNIRSQSISANLESPIVRCAAILMTYITRRDFPELYRILGYYVADASSDFSHLVAQGILIQYDQKSVFFDPGFIINPEFELKIIAGIPSSELDNYLKVYKQATLKQRTPRYQQSFVVALHNFLATGVTTDVNTEDCEKFFRDVNINCGGYPYRIITRMLQSDKYTSFFQNLGKEFYKYLSDIAIGPYERMAEIDSDLHNRYLFVEKDTGVCDIYSLIYVLQNELMVHGRLDDLITKYNDNALVTEYLKAVKGIYDCDFSLIYNFSLRYLDSNSVYIFEEPHLVMFLFGALIKDTSDTAMRLAQKLSKNREIKKSCKLLNALLEWKIKGTISPNKIEALSQTYYNPAFHVVFTLYAMHCRIFPQKSSEPYFISYYYKNVLSTSKMMYMRLLYAEADTSHNTQLDMLRKLTGMHSFLVDDTHKQKWQILLESIQSQMRSAPGASSASSSSSSRLAYLINPANLYVRPVLQKTSNGVTWSKGRNVALKALQSGAVEGMTPQDTKVAAAIRTEHTWSGISYYLNNRQALAALIGHPYVFTDDDNRLKVEIYSQPLELSVNHDSSGRFTFRFNVEEDKVDMGNVYIDASNPCSIRIVELTETQLRLMAQINTLGELPAEAADVLGDTLALLGSQMTVMSDLVRQGDDIRRTDGSTTLIVQLIPDGENIHAQVFAKPLAYYPPYLTPGQGSEFVSARVGNETVQTQRDLNAENTHFNAVQQLMQTHSNNQIDNTTWILSVAETLDVLSDINEIPDKAAVEWPEGVKLKVSRHSITPGDFHVKIKNVDNWFEVEGKIEISDDTTMKITELLERMQHSSNPRFIKLDDNEYVRLTDHLASVLRQISQTSQQRQDKHLRMSQFNALTLDDLEKAGVDVKGDRAYRRMIKLINAADTTRIRTPRNLEADLREYQKDGFKWMSRLHLWGAGACLADDMGLGKTLQTITLLLSLRDNGPSLVVAPASVLTNWKDEILRFAPALRPVVLNDAADASRGCIIASAAKGDIVITSYGLLVTKEEELCAVKWNVAVLDEAHTIKNRGTKMSKSAMQLHASMRVALTGTPLQNRLSEIWNIFQFINPGLLGSFESFTDRFINPIERDGNKDRQRALKRLISPFLLRRTKNDVLNELPPKSEITLRIDLSEEERAIYERMRREAEASVATGDGSTMMMLAQLTRLRQAACDVRLIYPDLKIESSKAKAFIDLVEDLIANNHRALVFSQFTSHLDLIRQLLDQKHISYLYLDGTTPQGRRAHLVSEFQGGDTPLFLISLKAGGLGLNLTGADYVIHLDPWWNPAIEEQASDRSYRMGQEKPVTVYRIIAANTIEDKILRLHNFKKSLADALLEGSDMSARLTKDDILNLLKEK